MFACACMHTEPLLAQMLNMNQTGGQLGGFGGGGGGGNSRQKRDKDKKSGDEDTDPCVPLLDKRFCYTLDPITGIVYSAVPDTTFEGLGNRESMESKALSIIYTGNPSSPHQVESFFDRRNNHDFIFLNAYNELREDASQMLYYNTRIPFTVARYSNSGGSINENDHLVVDFAGNFNKELGLGTKLDYTYYRGTYTNASSKPLKWKSYLYYNGEQYKAYFSYQKAKLANQENGGIYNRDHVLHPDTCEKAFTDPRTMPVRLSKTWNDNMLDHLHFQHNYVLGYWEDIDNPDDSTTTERLVPVGTIFHSIDFESWKHLFRMDQGADLYRNTTPYFNNYFYSKDLTCDSTLYRDFSTYAGIRLDEGFSRFSQFAIAAFVGYERQHYTMMVDSTNLDYIARNHISNNIWLGGQLSRHQSSILTFDATARTALSGDKLGDVEIEGTGQTVLPFGRRNVETGLRSDSIIVKVSGSFHNRHVSYMQREYFSNHFRWNINEDDISPEQHTRLEGWITYPRTGTSIRIGYENIGNYHYFSAPEFKPLEAKEMLNITALELRQNLHIGKWLNWDNAVLLQTTSNDTIMPLPQISIESDLSLRFRIAKTLHVHLGAACYYHTQYYTPTYQPALQQFGVQHDIKCGGFPIMNAYVNCNLKRIKFFVEMQNVLDKSITNNTFLMPYYPIEPRRFGFGIVLDLQN